MTFMTLVSEINLQNIIEKLCCLYNTNQITMCLYNTNQITMTLGHGTLLLQLNFPPVSSKTHLYPKLPNVYSPYTPQTFRGLPYVKFASCPALLFIIQFFIWLNTTLPSIENLPYHQGLNPVSNHLLLKEMSFAFLV